MAAEFATGFDAVDANYRSMDLRGRGGKHVNEHWGDTPTSYLGVTTAASQQVLRGGLLPGVAR